MTIDGHRSTRRGATPQGSEVRSQRRDLAVAAALAVIYLGALLATMGIGFTRDEGYYFKAGELYSGWFDAAVDRARAGAPLEALSRKVIDEHFAYNPEHPALPKLLFGASWRLLGRMRPPGVPAKEARRLYRRHRQPEPILGLLPESVAFRLPGALSAALLVALIYLFGARAFGRRAGLAAAVAYALMPRAWFHAHLACFDVPIALAWFATIYAFWRSLAGGWRWALATAFAFGLALSTKHNSWFLPFVMGLIVLLLRWRDLRLRNERGALSVSLPAVPWSLVLAVTLGPLLAWLLWPRMWFDTIARTGWYMGRHLHHEYYWAYFFNTLYTKPPFPWYFPIAMTLVTVPVVVLASAGLGVWRLTRGSWGPSEPLLGFGKAQVDARRRTLVVVLVNLIVPIATFCTTRTPIFGGTKHWLPAMPFFALLAGLGFDTLCGWAVTWSGAQRPAARRLVSSALGLVLAAPLVFAVVSSHPDSSSYYNVLLGGAPGMGEYGMQREFWGNSSRPVLPWLNANLAPKAPVFFQDTNHDSVLLYKRDGLLRSDIRPVRDWHLADYTLFHHHKEFRDSEYNYRDKYGDVCPVAGTYQQGVPLLSVYRNRAGWRNR